jgi:hypothetical protein
MPYSQKVYTPADASLTGFASNVTGAAFTLTATTSGDSLAHQVSIRNDSATDHSGKTVALVGTDQDGRAQTESVTGPAGSATVESSKYWLTLTSATPSATIGADTFDIGWVDEFATNTHPLNWRGGNAALDINVSGTINYDLEQTFDDIQVKTTAFNWTVDDTTTQSNQTADQTVLYLAHPKAIRLKINSYSSGASVTLSYTQRNE